MFRTGKLAAAAAVVAALGLAAAVAPAAHSASAVRAAKLSGLESGVLADMNALRRSRGLAPLRISNSLRAAAEFHAGTMATKGFFSHSSADGTAFGQRVKRFYAPGRSGYWSVGENLLWSSPDVSADGALEMWMNSPAHRANLLTARWREVGIAAIHVAAAPGMFKGLDVTIVAADFGVRR